MDAARWQRVQELFHGALERAWIRHQGVDACSQRFDPLAESMAQDDDSILLEVGHDVVGHRHVVRHPSSDS